MGVLEPEKVTNYTDFFLFLNMFTITSKHANTSFKLTYIVDILKKKHCQAKNLKKHVWNQSHRLSALAPPKRQNLPKSLAHQGKTKFRLIIFNQTTNIAWTQRFQLWKRCILPTNLRLLPDPVPREQHT